MGLVTPQLPRTLKVMNDIDLMLEKLDKADDIDETIDNFNDYERMLLDQTYMAIASALYREAPDWAVKIAECIFIMADMENRTMKIKGED